MIDELTTFFRLALSSGKDLTAYLVLTLSIYRKIQYIGADLDGSRYSAVFLIAWSFSSTRMAHHSELSPFFKPAFYVILRAKSQIRNPSSLFGPVLALLRGQTLSMLSR